MIQPPSGGFFIGSTLIRSISYHIILIKKVLRNLKNIIIFNNIGIIFCDVLWSEAK